MQTFFQTILADTTPIYHMQIYSNNLYITIKMAYEYIAYAYYLPQTWIYNKKQKMVLKLSC